MNMDNAVVQEQITEESVRQLEESKYLDYPLMNRIEGRIRTKDQLEHYIAVLVHKLEARQFRDEWLMDRVDRLLLLHQQLERYQRSGAKSAADYWDTVAASSN
jgi:hypothetical protein